MDSSLALSPLILGTCDVVLEKTVEEKNLCSFLLWFNALTLWPGHSFIHSSHSLTHSLTSSSVFSLDLMTSCVHCPPAASCQLIDKSVCTSDPQRFGSVGFQLVALATIHRATLHPGPSPPNETVVSVLPRQEVAPLSIQVNGNKMSNAIVVVCAPSHVVFSFWMQLLSEASRWCWTSWGSRGNFLCWSLSRRCLGLTGNATATRTQPMWSPKYQDLRRREDGHWVN